MGNGGQELSNEDRKRSLWNSPSCSGDDSILAMKSSHLEAVDGVNLATAVARRRVVAHLEYWLSLRLEIIVLGRMSVQ